MDAVKHPPKNDSIPLDGPQEMTASFLSVFEELLTDEEALLRHIASTTEKFIGKGEASVFLVTGPSNEEVITFKAGSSDTTNRRLAGFRLKMGEGVVGWTIKTGEPQLIGDVLDLRPSMSEPVFSADADELSDYPTRSLACAPMNIGQHTIGAIEVVDELPDCFTEADLGRLSSIADFSAMAIQKSRYIQSTKQLLILTILSNYWKELRIVFIFISILIMWVFI